MTFFYGEKLIFFRVPYSMREHFFENFYYRWIFIFSVGLWKWLLHAIYVASILALKYALIIDETYIYMYVYVFYRIEFDPLDLYIN